MKNAKHNALNKLSQLCENNRQGVSTVDNLIPKIFELLRMKSVLKEDKEIHNMQNRKETHEEIRKTFIDNLKRSYNAYEGNYNKIVEITSEIRNKYDAMENME